MEQKGLDKRPECSYEDKRNDNMLKVKPVYDEEAIVVDYTKGRKESKETGGICL